MNRQAEIALNVHGREPRDAIWLTIIRRFLPLCAASAVTLLFISESRLSPEQRQLTFETSGVYP
jgi:hypothetical protein